MIANMKKTLASALAFGIILLAGQAAQAVIINVGALPTDGSTLSFTGDTTTNGSDVYNFTLPFDVTGGTDAFFHVETGNANYDTFIRLFSGSNLGSFIALDNDSNNTFGDCENFFGGTNGCSSIGAGADPLARNGGTDATPLLAGDFSLEVVGFLTEQGTYEVRFTSQVSSSSVPEPGTLALFAIGLVGLGFMTRRRRKAA